MTYRLLYVSKAAAPDLAAALQDILLTSVSNNLRDGLSGFLICDGLNFAQALEGEADAVEARFARIVADPRHSQVRVLARGPAAARDFADWSMCALYLDEADDALLAPAEVGVDLHDLTPAALWRRLKGLADRHGARLDAEHGRLLAAREADPRRTADGSRHEGP